MEKKNNKLEENITELSAKRTPFEEELEVIRRGIEVLEKATIGLEKTKKLLAEIKKNWSCPAKNGDFDIIKHEEITDTDGTILGTALAKSKSQYATSQYATWEYCYFPKTDYFNGFNMGHYFTDELEAVNDFYKRCAARSERIIKAQSYYHKKQNEIELGKPKGLEGKQLKTVVINAFGGAGAGKTTAALSIAAELKKHGYVTEYVPEYAKELILSNNFAALDGTLKNQRKVYEEQKYRITRCIGKVDFVVTDCPIIISGMFLNDCPEKNDFQREILEQFNKNANFSFVIQRDENKFEQANRMGTFEEAKAMDADIQQYLKDNNVQFGCYDHAHLDNIVKHSIEYYEKLNSIQQNHYVDRLIMLEDNSPNISNNDCYYKEVTPEQLEKLEQSDLNFEKSVKDGQIIVTDKNSGQTVIRGTDDEIYKCFEKNLNSKEAANVINLKIIPALYAAEKAFKEEAEEEMEI